MATDPGTRSVILLDYAPLRKRWFLRLFVRCPIAGLIVVSAGGVAYWVTPPRFKSRAYLEVGPKLPSSPMGRLKDVYAFVDRESVQHVLVSSCAVARTELFREQVLTNSGLKPQEATAALPTLEVRSFDDSKFICVSVASDDPGVSPQVANAAMSMLIRRDGKVVVDPIHWAGTPAARTRTLVPALCTSAMTLCTVLLYVRSSGCTKCSTHEVIV
jgi:hypothetical protein